MTGSEAREVRITARRVERRRRIMRLIILIIIILLLLMSIVFAGASFLNKAGRFTINLDPEAFSKYGIAISQTEDFEDPTIILQGTALENMWNITQEWLLNKPDNRLYYVEEDPTFDSYDGLDKIPGDHNGKDYIAYTFWIKNTGEKELDYYGTLDIESATKGADDAIRVMVFRNGVYTVYGKAPRNPDVPYANFAIDEFFLSRNVVTDFTHKTFKPGDKDRYTVVIWLEGWDPECVNDIMGGEVKLSMNFKVQGEAKAKD